MTRYAFDFEPRYEIAARLFGITAANSQIDVSDGTLRARFGPWHVETPLRNIRAVSESGPYGFLKTAGPAHLSFSDRGLTFASNGRAGVCIEFAEPITGIDPFGRIKHPNLTLTPRDPAALVAELNASTPS